MPFEWDERKREVNLAKHGVDFELAKLIFDGPTRKRLISARKAGTDEQKVFYAQIPPVCRREDKG